jgi:hypothetical protein
VIARESDFWTTLERVDDILGESARWTLRKRGNSFRSEDRLGQTLREDDAEGTNGTV